MNATMSTIERDFIIAIVACCLLVCMVGCTVRGAQIAEEMIEEFVQK